MRERAEIVKLDHATLVDLVLALQEQNAHLIALVEQLRAESDELKRGGHRQVAPFANNLSRRRDGRGRRQSAPDVPSGARRRRSLWPCGRDHFSRAAADLLRYDSNSCAHRRCGVRVIHAQRSTLNPRMRLAMIPPR